MHRSNTVYKRKQSKTALNIYVGGFCCERQLEMDFFTGRSVIIDGLEWYGLLVDYCDVFGCLDTHSDGTHSLQRIHW